MGIKYDQLRVGQALCRWTGSVWQTKVVSFGLGSPSSAAVDQYEARKQAGSEPLTP